MQLQLEAPNILKFYDLGFLGRSYTPHFSLPWVLKDLEIELELPEPRQALKLKPEPRILGG